MRPLIGTHREARAAIGFAAQVDAALEKIKEHPGRFPMTFADCQCCRVQRYPYSVIYYRTNDEAVVLAIAIEEDEALEV